MLIIKTALTLAEHGLLPDFLIRYGIRQLCKTRLHDIHAENCEATAEIETQFKTQMNLAPIALVPELANEQHYEVPTDFFKYCLGAHQKYSSCFWLENTQSLDDAEANALKITCEHADLKDGQQILELGCGWGSLTLWMAEKFPNSQISAVSNSNSQREYITNIAKKRGLKNITVITCDMNVFDATTQTTQKQFDRIVSVEMFEHMRNWQILYGKIYEWLKPHGKFFKHIFVHRSTPYLFEVQHEDDWMSQFFFSGGMMPSDDLPLYFQQKLKLVRRWHWDGTHYEKTANAWLKNMDLHANTMTPILAATYGEKNVTQWRNRWRIFYMACAELFGFKNGQEWWLSHYLFERD